MLLALSAIIGWTLVAVGVVLRLCESSWQKPTGSMGSTWFLVIGILLCLPITIYLAPAIIDKIRSM